ncbi:MAG: 1-(5-phosphoribosyl)-5-[(5-phosphoribosylamino)methylideneamino]imidazole-4-carboxamide isomerase [Candidatus Omnitrophica bacterium]|nr:1-(5-phosphoribosyl)-5-[(5-phosphoribosylamino)methylideneamino]imidazole-4-carboxamide isomerase [Candidatus Omnitrophota bacterium]
MILFPAIDLKNGKVVRLLQGRFDNMTQYATNPVTVAQKWESLGAQWLHVVDLDGAQTGQMNNMEWIFNIVRSVKIPVQVGGGVRSEEIISRLISGGVSRVILGTRVVEDETFLDKVLAKWPDQVAVSLDHSGGFVVTRGWAVISPWTVIDLAKKLERLGLKYLISTNIVKDGMLQGPDYQGLKDLLSAVKISVIASGGISGLDDLKTLMAMNKVNLLGAITGKAIYEGKLDFSEAVAVCSTNV